MNNQNTEVTEKVGNFFESYSSSFDSIYGHEAQRSLVDKLTDKLFRQTMFVRFKKVLQYTTNPKITSIIDVGCGPGHYCAAFLRQGKKVTGLDLSEGMLKIAQKHVDQQKLNGSVTFIHDGYVAHKFSSKFDAACLMGFFDYILTPKEILIKLRTDITKEIYASFPKGSGFLAWQRKIRYKMRNCPLYYYSKEEVQTLLTESGYKNFEITSCKRDWFVRIQL